MGAPAIAQELLARGFTLQVSAPGKLVVRPASQLTQDLRRKIQDCKSELLGWVQETAGQRQTAPPHVLRQLTPEEASRVRSWSDAEMLAAERYMALAERQGYDASVAYLLSDHLVLRDRDGVDRQMCVECSHLDLQGRCGAARIGLLHDVPVDLKPQRLLLRECPTYVASMLGCTANTHTP